MTPPPRARLAADLAALDPELANFTGAIAAGEAPDALLRAIRQRVRVELELESG